MAKKSHINIFFNQVPISSIKEQIIASLIIGLFVFMILIMFQPYGTYSFHMEYKTLFLAGYGVIFAVDYSLYFIIVMSVFKKWFNPLRWNLGKEIITFLPVLFLLPLSAILYHNQVLGGYTIRLIDIIYFFYVSLSVSILPFSLLFYRKWMKSKLISINQLNDSSVCTITFESNNKKEKSVTVESDKLLYIKSDGNYIDIFDKDKEKPYQIRNSLHYVENQLLEQNFIRIHRSYIVNAKIIKDLVIVGTVYNIELEGCDLKLPVSRSKIKEIRDILK